MTWHNTLAYRRNLNAIRNQIWRRWDCEESYPEGTVQEKLVHWRRVLRLSGLVAKGTISLQEAQRKMKTAIAKTGKES